MNRRPEVSLGLGLAVATMVLGLYSRGMPNMADVRVGEQGDNHLDAVRQQNLYMSAAVVSGIALLAKDQTIFVVGGLTLVAVDWMTRLNNWADPVTGAIGEARGLFRADDASGVAPVGYVSDQGGYGELAAVP